MKFFLGNTPAVLGLLASLQWAEAAQQHVESFLHDGDMRSLKDCAGDSEAFNECPSGQRSDCHQCLKDEDAKAFNGDCSDYKTNACQHRERCRSRCGETYDASMRHTNCVMYEHTYREGGTGEECQFEQCQHGDQTCSSKGGPTCFSKDASVQVFGQGATPLENLNIGDQVLVGSSPTTRKYEPIYAFLHADKSKEVEYLQIFATGHDHDGKVPLEITEEHLLFAHGKLVPAEDITVGQTLEGEHEGKKVVVTKIKKATKTGLYVPLTPSGTLLVDGVKTSCYANIHMSDFGLGNVWDFLEHPTFMHVYLGPLRVACMGISSKFFGQPNSGGFPFYVSALLFLANRVGKLPNVFQAFLLVLFVAVNGIIYGLECMLGAARVPLVCFFGALALYEALNEALVVRHATRKMSGEKKILHAD